MRSEREVADATAAPPRRLESSASLQAIVAQGGPAAILALQRASGNAAVSRLVARSREPATGWTQQTLSRAFLAPRPGRVLARNVNTQSADYLRGYNDGRAQRDRHPGPIPVDALDDYQEGYANGKTESDNAGTSLPPADAPPSGTAAPNPPPATAPTPADAQTSDDDEAVYDTSTPASIAGLDLPDRLLRSISYAGPAMGKDVVHELAQLLSPTSIAIFAAFIAAQFVGAGEVADAVGVSMLIVKIGTDAFKVVGDLKDFLVLTVNAKSDDDLHKAGDALGRAIVTAGIDALMAVMAAKGGGEAADEIAVEEGAVSQLAREGGLAANEGPGLGHTLAKHVGKTDAELAARLAAQPKIPAASSFTNRAVAEAANREVLDKNAVEIAAWLKNPKGNLPLKGKYSGGVTGRSVPKGQTTGQDVSGTLVVLKAKAGAPGGWFILTSYPIPWP